MAITSTICRFNIDLSDVDRGIYDALELRVAKHPSESVPYLVTRVLAYALNVQEGLVFAKGGLSQTENPALFIEDLTGIRTHWFEIGHPNADRLHRASKAVDCVRVYTHKPLSPWFENVQQKEVHRAEHIEVVALAPEFVAELADKVVRNNNWAIVHTEGELYVTIGEETVSGATTVHRLG